MHSLPLLACLGVCLALSGASGRPRGASSTFFACEPGFTFEASGDAARCRRLARVTVTPMTDCPRSGGTALTEQIDRVASKDMCASTADGATVSLDRSCPPGFTKRVLPGPDRCEMPTPEMIRAPSIPVAR